MTKKSIPQAVMRNKIRRRVYAVIQNLLIPPTPPQAILVQCDRKTTEIDSKEFSQELTAAIKKAVS